jgi:hypothetical protein
MKNKALLMVALAAVTAIACTLLPASLATSPASAAANLIQNPGFEDPDTGVDTAPASWTASTSAPYRDDVPDTHSGSYSAYLHGTSGSYQQIVSVGANTVYRFEAFTRATAAGADVVIIQIRDSAQNIIDYRTWSGSDHGWTLRLAYINTPSNAWDANITLAISGGATAEVWFDDISLEEKLTTGECFIATAAYGSATDEHVDVLRGFRDGFLSDDSVGATFVSAYYRTSPPVAGFIDEHPALKPIVKAGLLPSVAISNIATGTSFLEKVAVAGLTMLLAILLALGLRSRLAKRRV